MLDERVRSSLYRQLTEQYGEQEATAVVEAVASIHRQELATRDQMERGFAELRAEFHTEIAGVRNELHTEIAGVRTEIAGVRTELAGVRTEIAEVRTEIADMGQKVVMWMVPTMATMTALSWAAARFAG